MSAWKYAAYRWADEAAWLAAVSAEGWAEGAPPGVELLAVGRLSLPQEPTPQGEEALPPIALPGWHVAVAFRDVAPPSAWNSQRIEPPEGMPVLGRTPVPPSVTRFQARAALAMAGLLDGVESAVAASPDILTQLAWADAQVFERSSPTIAGLSSALDLTDAQIDDLFRTAAEIVA